MNPTASAAIQTSKPLRTRVTIMADSSSQLPTRIELIKAGTWPATSVKGPLTITTADLQEFKSNFDAGVGIPSGLGKLPIDFSHDDWAKAAGWITALDVEGDTLYATVEWSTSGADALQGAEYKCISPSFWPACLGEWYDPEDSEVTARNVLVGAGLTNIPFFKALTPIMASITSDNDGKIKNVIYIKADERKSMQIDEIRVKDATALTDEEKQFLLEHKAELSAEELTKFEIKDEANGDKSVIEQVVDNNKNNEGDQMTEEVQEAVAIAASVKKGEKVVMDASEVKAMREQIEAHSKQLGDYREKEVKASVTKHLERGAIKADQVEVWTKQIMADATVEALLEAIPANPVMASEHKDANVADVANAAEQFESQVQEAIKASEGKLSYSQAVVQVATSNPQLANDRQKQLSGKN